MHQAPRTAVSLLGGALLALGLLAGCGDDPSDPDPSAGPTSTADGTTDPSDPSSGAAADPGATGDPDATDGRGEQEAAVPAYYVGRTPTGDRLYREFRRVPADDLLTAAAAAVTDGDPLDPDYRTLWPGGRFAGVTQEQDAIVVEVADESWLGRAGLSAAEARLAVQQLVYTLQGTVGDRLPVRVEHEGRPAQTLLGVRVGSGLTARPQLDVLALVDVTEPTEGATVGETFTANGRASSFEGTVVWEVLDEDGAVVLNGFAQADGWVDRLYPWETQVSTTSLAPGSYTFVARTDDPSDGEGSGPTEDTKRITVR
ncbi:Gmad2 immunoglobulin-like domain-containing protein [Nocardioides sp. SYSU DS0651]|uniref:Gmad2 immunoglobulin-like domain-containing protein n=1 Tax=Nocardioides sp. SYSU DS0651 TaxID=3415955 RepID=UPI003F4C3827